MPINVLQAAAFIIMPVFIFLITSDLFSGEFNNRTIIGTLVRPITRSKVYLSKVLSVIVFIIGFLAITFIVSFMASFLGGSISEIIERFPINLLVYLTAIVPMALVIVMTAFTAQFFKSSGSTIVIMILSFIGFFIFGLLSELFRTISPVTYIDWYNNFDRGSYDLQNIIKELMFILSYGIIFLSTGLYLFTKKDV